MSGQVEQLRQRLADAFADALPDQLPSRYVVVLETLTDDGARGVWLVAPDGQYAWDTLGMLDYARMIEHAGIARDEGDRDE